MPVVSTDEQVEVVRRFNRFYTRQLGLLQERLLRSPFSLSEGRVMYELAQHQPTTATSIGEILGLDAGYQSRIVRNLRKQELVTATASTADRRQYLLSLTEAGTCAFAELDAAARQEIGATLGALTGEDRRRLTAAMATIERLLGTQPESRVPYVLRTHRPGDMGWVVYRHGVLYSHEYGWDERFEALVAAIVAKFIEQFDDRREHCWIAERDGENVGSVFLVKDPEHDGVARLRLLLVEPAARGLGIGRRLVQECSRFARQAGYQTITLWTNSVLQAARRLYELEGYQLVREEPHHSFGRDLVGETWSLTLQ